MITDILTPLLTKLLRYLIGGLCTYLVAKGYADSEAAGGIGEHLSAIIPQILGIIFAVGWDLWAHISKTSFIAKVQTSLGLPATGKPTAEAAQIIKAIGEDVGNLPPPRPSVGVVPLLILAPFLLLTVGGCTDAGNADKAFRSNFDSVAVTGSYGSADGQTVGGGIKLGVRPPSPDKSK